MICEATIEEVLRPLIEVDTSNPPGLNYGKVTQVIEKQLSNIECNIQLITAPAWRVKELIAQGEKLEGERVNLVASLERGTGKTMILNGHIDVVPATGNWKFPPFKLTKSGDLFYGRGVADMKGSLAALIQVFRDLAEDESWRGKLILTATCDEEIGGYTGLGYLMDEKLVEGDYCIVGDGDSTYVTNASNGRMSIRLTINGKSAHASRNWIGVNAVYKAAHLIDRIEKLNAQLIKKRSKVPASKSFGVDFLTPSITVGLIRGGTKVNVVPDQCVLEIDRRVIPEENKESAITQFQRILKGFEAKDKDFMFDLLIADSNDSFYTSKDHELLKALASSFEEVRGGKCEILGSLGCFDATYPAKYGIPVAVYGTSSASSNVHGVDENTKISDTINFGKIVEKAVLKLLK